MFGFSSTRVIKPNGPDIGRKVKVKNTGRTIPPPSAASRQRDASGGHANNPLGGQQSLRLTSSSSSSSSTYKAASQPPAARNLMQPEKKLSDIMRRPLRYINLFVFACLKILFKSMSCNSSLFKIKLIFVSFKSL